MAPTSSLAGMLLKNQMIQLCPSMPAMNTAHFAWLCMGDSASQKSIFNLLASNNRAVKLADCVICNSFYELEPSVFTLLPNLKPIGPLFGSNRLAHFWPEDSTCLSWLDRQPAKSVIYVAFGSYTIFDKQQFEELALGLELSGKCFLKLSGRSLLVRVLMCTPMGLNQEWALADEWLIGLLKERCWPILLLLVS
ncbi:hypothetical protein IFM89_008105 [Coptis chinensis]|uniref:Uncharacterized protein n=1 Tax=Coptis chinensis TaxID=261450 RepID=A0A835IXR4_9MAGN|nr:hypothetical protein IFM89_008105 [Coptis chinensis]